MGTWGPGNFENDGASDWLLDHLSTLINDVKKHMSYERLIEAGSFERYGEELIVPSLDVVITLARAYDVKPDVERRTVDRWRRDYLAVFEEKGAILYPSDKFRKERRKIIEDTFSVIQSLAWTEDLEEK